MTWSLQPGERREGSSRFPRETEIQRVLFQLVGYNPERKPNLLLEPGQRQLIKSGTMKTETGSTQFKRKQDGESVMKYINIVYCPTGKTCIQSVKTNLCILISCTIRVSCTNTGNQIKLQYQNLLCTVKYVNKEECEGNMITSMCGMGLVVSMDLCCPLVHFWSHIKVKGSLGQGGLAGLRQAYFRGSFHVCHSISPHLPLSDRQKEQNVGPQH